MAEGQRPGPLASADPSLNYLLSSHVWRQDNNGFSHQDPGFIDHVVNKKASVVRVYFLPTPTAFSPWPITAYAAMTTSM